MSEAYFVSNLFFGYNHELFAGGMEIHLKNIVELVCKHGFHSTILQRWYKNELIYRDESLKVQGVKIPFYLYNLIWKKKVQGKPKIIHLNDIVFSFPNADNKTSVTFHGVSWDIPINNIPTEWALERFLIPKALFVRHYYIMNTRYAIKRCKKILSVDNSLLYLTQHELPQYRDKIKTIPNFVDINKFYPTNSTKSKFGLSTNDFVVLYPRNISLARGYFLLFDIIKKIAKRRMNVKFLIVGGKLKELGKDKYFSFLYSKINKEKLMDYVRFMGSIPHDKMNDVFNAADIVIIPTFFGEGSSLAALEAMACQKTIIASNIGGLNGIIIDGYNGFLIPPHAELFVSKILYLRDNKEVLKYTSRNALRLAREVYNKKRWEKQVLDFFEI